MGDQEGLENLFAFRETEDSIDRADAVHEQTLNDGEARDDENAGNHQPLSSVL